MNKEGDVHIPVSIFSSSLSPLESVICYLRDEKKWDMTHIAERLGRRLHNVNAAYDNVRDRRDFTSTSTHTISLSRLASRELSILEHVVWDLGHSMPGYQIAKLLNKSPGAISTTLLRARKKTIASKQQEVIAFLSKTHNLSEEEIATFLKLPLEDVRSSIRGDHS